jgi:predicted small lipoprotein YifL
MSGIRALLIFLAIALLAACGRNAKPDLPPAGGAVTPVVQVVERRVYVPIDDTLTRPEPIAEGPISMCFDVAAQRRAAIERGNAKLKAIGAKQGTVVTP